MRGALERVVASEAFRSSPQLGTFLRFVVEAMLRSAKSGRAEPAGVSLARDAGVVYFLPLLMRRLLLALALLTAGLARLSADLESGEWDARYGQLRQQPEFIGALRLIAALP